MESSTPPDPPAPCSSERLAIYQQDCEFLRYRDGVKWNRFQTTSAIEGAALYAAFEVERLGPFESLAVMGIATLLIVCIFALAITDDRASAAHVLRIRAFEQACGHPYKLPKLRAFFGIKISRLVMVAVLLFNAAVMIRLIRYPAGL